MSAGLGFISEALHALAIPEAAEAADERALLGEVARWTGIAACSAAFVAAIVIWSRGGRGRGDGPPDDPPSGGPQDPNPGRTYEHAVALRD